eukprot:8847370-Pyramimonas_sp.AAC.1
MVDCAIVVPLQPPQFLGRKRAATSRDQESATATPGRSFAAERGEETAAQVGPRLGAKSKRPIEAAGGRAQQLVRAMVRTVDADYI